MSVFEFPDYWRHIQDALNEVVAAGLSSSSMASAGSASAVAVMLV
jgi:hypothetical protein